VLSRQLFALSEPVVPVVQSGQRCLTQRLSPRLSNYLRLTNSYDKYWNRESGAIWFYNGNEADVTLYIDHSGIMWENAQAAGALLVFAEHRCAARAAN
jgi:lysosomal Pro-X carboxypeptidase